MWHKKKLKVETLFCSFRVHLSINTEVILYFVINKTEIKRSIWHLGVDF